MLRRRHISMDFSYNYPQIAKDCGFKFRYYKDGPLDWRLIGSLEIERILNEQNFEQIDGVLSHISEAPLASMLDSNILDSGVVKYFILSQFSVQYLLFCRKFLEETVTELRDHHGSSQMEIATLKKSLSEANTEILQLHKKITQMEAIHEVIYPCHLCTKNFVSNDALNLHISRKHNGNFCKQEKKSEETISLIKDRENDFALINTIKLELEIKQLKERLNNTEREIREKNIDNALPTKDRATDCLATPRVSVHSIGIQSNLCEIKERDDKSEDDLSTSSENRQQLGLLLEKLQDLERWKEEQKMQNSELLTEINKNFREFGAAVELTKNNVLNEEKPQTSSASVENLELILSKKIEDIGKANDLKLNEIVNKIETKYKDKLEKFETELKRMQEKNNKEFNAKKDLAISNIPKKLEAKDNTLKKTEQKDFIAQEESSKSNSNHTFIKSKNAASEEYTSKKSICSDSSEDDTTDISESNFDEEKEEEAQLQFNYSQSKVRDLKTPTKKPKILTKYEAKKLANSRLLLLGLNMKTKTLTPALRKQASLDLNEKRNNLKQKYPHFYATRNKIKRFVDKLCSAKMPENAEKLLRVTKPSRPLNLRIDNQFNEDSSTENEINSIEASRNTNKEFKQRLESILSSPIRKPDEYTVKAMIHDNNITQQPVPIPRKRVIFNQPERQDSISSFSETDEAPSLESNQK